MYLYSFFLTGIIMETIESSMKSENDEFELAPLIEKTTDVEAFQNSEKKNTK